jgi:uncharacterized protein (TIGR03000 family)
MARTTLAIAVALLAVAAARGQGPFGRGSAAARVRPYSPRFRYYDFRFYYPSPYPSYPRYLWRRYHLDSGGGESYAPAAQGLLTELPDEPGAKKAAGPARSGPADITVVLPAAATLWAQGKKMPGSGPSRAFSTPTLDAGRRYSYDFRATWPDNDRLVTQSQTVTVTAGARVTVRFPVDRPEAPVGKGR